MKQDRPSRLAGMSGIGVDRAGNRADASVSPDLLRLENLDTDVPPHPSVIAATQAAITADHNNSYLPFPGQRRLREAVAAHVSRTAAIAYDPDRNVLISAGGLSGILNVLLAIVEPGDEVILTDTTYIGLINRVRLAGGVPKFAPWIKSGRNWVLDRDALGKVVSSKTCALLMMSPSMPSGAYLTRQDWETIADLAREHDLWLINDAAMERILFDGRAVIHPASLPGMADRVITVGAASKELRMIGWRVGWIVAPQRIVPDLALVSISNVVVPVGIAQEAAAVALELGDRDVQAATAIWQARRDLLLAELDTLPVMHPAGGWSLLIDAAAMGLTSEKLADRLFTKAQIAATPMNGWGSDTSAGYLRLVYANEPVERLRGIGKRFQSAL
jgi:N-succinyldiaminopimelate aminotransferase